MYSNQTAFDLVWEADDLTPWNYTIFVNDTVIDSGPWYGEDIHFLFNITGVGNTTLTVKVFDLFGRSETDSVIIQVQDVTSPPSRNPLPLLGVLVVSIGLLGIVTALLLYQSRFRR